MKLIHALFRALLLLVLTSSSTQLQALPQGGKEASRVIEQVFLPRPGEVIQIVNYHGDVRILTAAGSSASIKIVLTASGSSPEQAQQRLETVSVSELLGEQGRSWTTVIEGSISPWLAQAQGIRADYEISAPADQALRIEIRHGELDIQPRSGALDLSLRSAKLRASRLEGSVRLDMDASQGEVEHLSQGDLHLQGARLRLESAGTLTLHSRASRVELMQGEQVALDAQLGELYFRDLARISGQYEAASCAIGKLRQSAHLQVRYAPPLEISELAPGFDSLRLEGKITAFHLGVGPGTGYEMTARLQRGELDLGDSGQEIRLTQRESENERLFQTSNRSQARNAGPSGLISIEGQRSNVRLRNLAEQEP